MRNSTRITAIVAAGALAVGAGAAAVAIADNGGGGQGRMSQADRSGMGMGGGRNMDEGAGGGMGRGHGAGMGQGGRRGMHGNAPDGRGQGAGMGAITLPARTDSAPLSTAEAAAVTYMREEEKLARDVYRTLADTSGNPKFTRIAASEQRHMDALGQLIARYGLTDPTAGKAQGQFESAKLQQLYTDLVAKGSASPAAALEVGRTIERLDIEDLNQRERSSKHSDVRFVFRQLERGSNMHLRAFTMQAG